MGNQEFNKEVGKYRNYYNIFDSLEGNVTESDFENWLNELPEPMKSGFSKQGMEKAKLTLPFQRWYLERNGHSLEEYLKKIE